MHSDLRDDHIAVVGMACRFPGANNADEYWRNLSGGVESITWLSDEELAANGVSPREFRHPHYVKAAFCIDEMDGFDARFFHYTPREAEISDPQGRLFLETCYAAVEDSGYHPGGINGQVGVVGGGANTLYGERNVKKNSAVAAAVGNMAVDVTNNPDYLASTVSYRLGFRGPSLSVQTACSTALLAVHTAGQLLRNGECDYALAGGVEVELPYRVGNTWVEGSIHTRTGHVRPFDADASGTMFATGVGVVALKRLGDALADGDHIYGVLRGSAVNNDGGDRAGFTAPGVDGQAQLIVEALAVAEVHPDTIGFVEAHATGTLVGDPIELAGLTRAYRAAGSTRTGTIPIGSAKANVGHLGPASGVAGLMKVCLALTHEAIPPTVNFETPNPGLGLDDSPFYVVTELTKWPAGDTPRRAGVSSFGIGGTNVHVVVEEAPRTARRLSAPPAPDRRWHTIPVSGRTATAAQAAAVRLGSALAAGPDHDPGPDLDLGNVAFTAQTGRAVFEHRRAVAAESTADAAAALAATTSPRQAKGSAETDRKLAMLFPGQGTQYPGMGRDLYDTEPVFRSAVDRCAALLTPHLGLDIRELLFPTEPAGPQEGRLHETRYGQPAVFVIECSLAMLLGSAGVRPDAMLGHSIGEYVAACLAGVFTLPDALALVAERGRLMQRMAPGTMLAVAGPAFIIDSLVASSGEAVEVAAVNGPRSTVISGEADAVARARESLRAGGIEATELVTSHAFHSRLMEPCLAEFEAAVAAVRRAEPVVPFVSNVTGRWITGADATDPAYWARHLRSAVLFEDGVATLTEDGGTVLLEVGPGDTLSKLARQCLGHQQVPVLAAMRHSRRTVPDDRLLAETLGGLWCHGVTVDWAAWTGKQNRVPLPGYPFERKPYFLHPDADPDSTEEAGGDRREESRGPLPAGRCTFAPSWREEPVIGAPADITGCHFLVLDSGHPVATEFVGALTAAGAAVTVARAGTAFAQDAPHRYTLRAADADDLEELLDRLAEAPPTDIVHMLSLTEPAADVIGDAAAAAGREGFYSLLHLGQRLARRGGSSVRLHVVSSNMQEISGTELLEPGKALLLGPVMLAQREIVNVTARSIDIELPAALPAAAVARQLLAEVTEPSRHEQVGWRGRKRWRLDYQPVEMDTPPRVPTTPGTYLVTGGLGALGMAVADELADQRPGGVADGRGHTIVLLGRSAMPPQADWPALVAAPDTAPELRGKLARLLSVEERGSTVVTVQCDVADPVSLAATVAEVHDRFGRIDGVFHSAGVAGGALMAVRGAADAAEVLAPKVDGTLALWRLLGDEIGFLVLFSSLTAANGSFGQVDYCAANNFLDAFARWAAQHGKPVFSIGWTQWTESGMSADRETAAPQAFRELQVGARFQPSAHPLLDHRVQTPDDAISFRTLLEPGKHWISAEHLLGGHDVVVGTALLEMVDGAYRESVGGVPEIRDAVFIGPIGVTGPTGIRIDFRPAGPGHDVVVSAGSPADDGTGWSERLRCQVVPYVDEPASAHDLAAIRARCDRMTVTGADLTSAGGMIDQGPHFGNVTATEVGHREEISLVEIHEDFRAECGRYRLHPGLLDSAVADANYAEDRRERGENYLPFSYGRLRVHEPLPPRFWSHLRHLGEPGAEVDRMTVVLMHDDGQEIARIDEYAERRVDPAAIEQAVEQPVGSATVVVPDAAALPPAQRLDEASVTPELGRDVLRRILYWRPAPHLLVVPEGIHRNLRRSRSVTMDLVQRELSGARLTGSTAGRARAAGPTHAETEVQRTLVALWEGALGVEHIGVDDDFFALGGNSLVAVQLASRMRDALATELPIAILLDHPTVRALADYLEHQS